MAAILAEERCQGMYHEAWEGHRWYREGKGMNCIQKKELFPTLILNKHFKGNEVYKKP